MELLFLLIVGLALVLSIAAAITDTTSNNRHRRRQTRHWSNSHAGDSTGSCQIFDSRSLYSDGGSSYSASSDCGSTSSYSDASGGVIGN